VAETQDVTRNLKQFKASNIDRVHPQNYFPFLFLGTRKLDTQALLACMGLSVRNADELEQFVLDPVVA